MQIVNHPTLRPLSILLLILFSGAQLQCSGGGDSGSNPPKQLCDNNDCDEDGVSAACDSNDTDPSIKNFIPACNIDEEPTCKKSGDCDVDGLANVCDAFPADATQVTPRNGSDGCDIETSSSGEALKGDGFADVTCDPYKKNSDGTLDRKGTDAIEKLSATLCDNCATRFNPDQKDSDGDGLGDVCDSIVGADKDGDGILDATDNCVDKANRNQEDMDSDKKGDACDDDIDGDSKLNASDNCPSKSNADQKDTDHDGKGDVCDEDSACQTDTDCEGWAVICDTATKSCIDDPSLWIKTTDPIDESKKLTGAEGFGFGGSGGGEFGGEATKEDYTCSNGSIAVGAIVDSGAAPSSGVSDITRVKLVCAKMDYDGHKIVLKKGASDQVLTNDNGAAGTASTSLVCEGDQSVMVGYKMTSGAYTGAQHIKVLKSFEVICGTIQQDGTLGDIKTHSACVNCSNSNVENYEKYSFVAPNGFITGLHGKHGGAIDNLGVYYISNPKTKVTPSASAAVGETNYSCPDDTVAVGMKMYRKKFSARTGTPAIDAFLLLAPPTYTNIGMQLLCHYPAHNNTAISTSDIMPLPYFITAEDDMKETSFMGAQLVRTSGLILDKGVSGYETERIGGYPATDIQYTTCNSNPTSYGALSDINLYPHESRKEYPYKISMLLMLTGDYSTIYNNLPEEDRKAITSAQMQALVHRATKVSTVDVKAVCKPYDLSTRAFKGVSSQNRCFFSGAMKSKLSGWSVTWEEPDNACKTLPGTTAQEFNFTSPVTAIQRSPITETLIGTPSSGIQTPVGHTYKVNTVNNQTSFDSSVLKSLFKFNTGTITNH